MIGVVGRYSGVMGDYTSTDRTQRWRARQRGEDVPLRRPGRSGDGSRSVECAPLDHLLAEVHRRISPREPLGVVRPGTVELYEIRAAIEDYARAIRRVRERVAGTAGDRWRRL